MKVRRSVSGCRSPAQALLWLTLAIPLFVSMAGLAIDGGLLLDSRRDLQSIADGAARAGATRLDMDRLRASGGADVELEPGLARQAARQYMDQSLVNTVHVWDAPPESDIEVGARRVHVQMRANIRTAFLRVVFIDNVPVEASAFADVQFGIHDGAGH
jgi:Flp pilus assembly protein TadG